MFELMGINPGESYLGSAPANTNEWATKLGDEGRMRRPADWDGAGRWSVYRIVRNAASFALTSAHAGRVMKLSEDGKTILGFAWAIGDKIAVLDERLYQTVNIGDLCLVQVPGPGGLVKVRAKAAGYNTDIAAGEKLTFTTGSGLTDTAAGRLAKSADIDSTPSKITQIHFRAVSAVNNLSAADALVLCEIVGNFSGFAASASS